MIIALAWLTVAICVVGIWADLTSEVEYYSGWKRWASIGLKLPMLLLAMMILW